MESKLDVIRDLIATCSLPELKVNLDDAPIHSSHFDDHRNVLDNYLPLFLDFLHQNQGWLLSKGDSETSAETKARIVVLFCELTAQNTLYSTHNKQFIKTINAFIRKHFSKILEGKQVEEHVLKYFMRYLKTDTWKRHLGSVHAFARFIELKVSCDGKLPIQWANFSLSIGLTLRECHLPLYKELSTTIFQTIINHSDPSEIKRLNMAAVIFDAVFKSVKIVESVEGTRDVWECLCKCLEFSEDVDSWEWNSTDEMMEALLGAIKLASDSKIVICLLSFVPKVLVRFTPNRNAIDKLLVKPYDVLSEDDIEELRNECSKISSCASYRWALYILKLFLEDSHRFLTNASISAQMLRSFHICYLTTIYFIEVEVMNINLLNFFEQFSKIMAETIATHKGSSKIQKLVGQIYDTFTKQLQSCEFEGKTKDFEKYYKAFIRFSEEQC